MTCTTISWPTSLKMAISCKSLKIYEWSDLNLIKKSEKLFLIKLLLSSFEAKYDLALKEQDERLKKNICRSNSDFNSSTDGFRIELA